MNPELYLADLEAKPAALAALASALETGDPFDGLPAGIRRVVFLGMGSSRYAARVAALRLRAAGVDAVAEYASAAASYPALRTPWSSRSPPPAAAGRPSTRSPVIAAGPSCSP